MSVTATDIMAAKIASQLGLVPFEELRVALLRLEADEDSTRDLVNRLADSKRLDPRGVELVRQRAALYAHVRGEASYVRLLERSRPIPKGEVAALIAELEKTAFRRRLGDVLVQRGAITREQDRVLLAAQREAVARDDARIVERYRKEDFAGIARPLVPGTSLAPGDFKISTLFRTKETRALVDRIEVAPEPPPPPETPRAKGIDRVRGLERIGVWRVVELLGAGGMGAVFLAQKEGEGRYAAVKVLLDDAAGPEELGRFQREAEIGKRLDHPNVIKVLDSGRTEDGMTWLVVPALAGKELRAHMKARGERGLDPAFALRVFEQVLEGMEAVHEARIVHRDMKPENVFVMAGGGHEVRIMDFGLAKLEDEAERGEAARWFRRVTRKGSRKVLGSPAYIAPESVTGDLVDRRTDIYSLGVMFFEMLAGLRPLESESAEDYLVQHLVQPPLRLSEARPERRFPRALDDLVARMLGKTRDERPASCRAVLEELRAIGPELLRGAPEEKPARETPAPSSFGFVGILGRLLGTY